MSSTVRTNVQRIGAVAFATAALIAFSTTIAQAAGQTASKTTAQKALATITLATKPSPPVTGDNVFTVTVKGADGKPVIGADVSGLVLMPAMPAMNMAEMKNTIALEPTEGRDARPGEYSGRGRIPMAGKWNVTVSVKLAGKELAQEKLTITAK